jgi:peptide/nickel transport system substrate-binding protein
MLTVTLRRRSVHRLALVTVMMLSVALTGCVSAKSKKQPGGDPTLVTAFHADMQVPDPDIFYEAEGLQVTTSAYEGLLQYDPTSKTVVGAKIVGLLAERWEVSPDGKTYTFHLRPKLTFADGSPVTSADVVWSMKRRAKINQGAAYMVGDIARYETPDAGTVVLHLRGPVSAFLDYMASPYGPKVLSEKIVGQHAEGDDLGQKWLASHSAGTGPFQIAEFKLGDHYRLARNEKYWGGRPSLAGIRINIIPDSSNSVLQVQNGDLDLTHDVIPATYQQLSANPKLKGIKFPALFKEKLNLNAQKPPFDNLAMREAVRAAINRSTLVPQVWGPLAVASTQMTPRGMLPDGAGADSWDVSAAQLTTLVSALPAAQREISLVFQSGAVQDQRMSQAVQTVLIDAGFKVSARPVPIADTFKYRDSPVSSQPNAELELDTPDAAHPETFAGIYYRSTGGLDFFHSGDKGADALMDKGLRSTSAAEVNRYYGQAMDILHSQAKFITIADVDGSFVANKCLEGYTMTAAAPFVLNLAHARLTC